jgi:hypothetical protein
MLGLLAGRVRLNYMRQFKRFVVNLIDSERQFMLFIILFIILFTLLVGVTR